MPKMGQQLWAKPVYPHSEDDEFESSSLSSDWKNYAWTDNVYGTISEGSVDTYDGSFTTGNVLRATVNSNPVKSWVLLQAPNGRPMVFVKGYALPTNVLIVSRIKINQYYSGQVNNDRAVGLQVFQDVSTKPDRNNRVTLYMGNPSTTIVRSSFFRTISGSSSTPSYTTDIDSKGKALEYLALHKIGTTYHGWFGTASGNWIYMGSVAFSGTIAHVGIFVLSQSLDKPGVAVVGMDFIRFYETDNFLF